MTRSRRRIALLAALAVLIAAAVLLATRPPAIAPGVAATPSGSIGPVDVSAAIPPPDPLPWSSLALEEMDAPFGADQPPIIRMDGVESTAEGMIGWGRASTPNRNQFNDMGAVFVSLDGRSWRTALIDRGVGPGDTSELAGVAIGLHGLLAWGGVCCVTEQRAVWLSDDGLAWTRVPIEGDVDITRSWFADVVAVDDGWVAVGTANDAEEPTIWTSGDGSTWSAVDREAAGLGAGTLADLAVTVHGLVAVGTVDGPDGTHDGGIWSSADGHSWERIGGDDPMLSGPGETELWSVVPHAGGLFVTGSFGSTEDRENCEKMLGKLASLNQLPPPETALSCSWGTEHHWVSPDGEDWQRLDPAALEGERPIEFRIVIPAGPGLVVLGESSAPASPDTTLFTSADGRRWSVVEAPDELRQIVAVGMAVRGRQIIAIGEHFDGQASAVRVWVGRVD